VTLRLIRNFINGVDKATGANLSRQLSQFEDNVLDETASIRSGFMAALQVRAREEQSSKLSLSPGSAAGFNTVSGDVSFLLPKPNQADSGRFVAVWKTVAANNVNAQATSGTTINGASSVAFAALGLHLIFCDGERYWA
jgi:hypothetical protein